MDRDMLAWWMPGGRMPHCGTREGRGFIGWDGLRCNRCNPLDGVPELKRPIAARSIGGENGGGVDEIVVTNGYMDAIQLCLQAVAKPGDIVVAESPTFSCYFPLIEDDV